MFQEVFYSDTMMDICTGTSATPSPKPGHAKTPTPKTSGVTTPTPKTSDVTTPTPKTSDVTTPTPTPNDVTINGVDIEALTAQITQQVSKL